MRPEEPTPTLQSPNDVKLPSRLTMVQRIYHQRPYEQAVMLESVWDMELQSTTRQKVEDLDVGEEWTEIGFRTVSMVAIQNHRKRWQVIPTPEEVAAEESKVLHICFTPGDDEADLILPPGRSTQFFLPSDFKAFYVRCAQGVTPITVTLYPR